MNNAPIQGLLAAYFPDRKTGWVTGDFGVICKTNDGGASWTRQDVQGSAKGSTFFAMAFGGSDQGWAVGEYGAIVKYRSP